MNEAIAGPGNPSKKRQDVYNNNKKRRKNETPPPSRRPQGLPNVPPPRPVTPPVKLSNARPTGPMKEIVVLSDILEDKVDVEELKETDKLERVEKTEKILENGLSPEKRALGKSVNKQLRKMQEMHKNKLSKGTKNNKSETKIANDESASPILSILRTSFANEEVTRTQDVDEEIEVDIGSKRKQKQAKKEEVPAKRARTDANVPSKPLSEKSCRLLLQSYQNTKLRMEAWREMRNIKGISTVSCFF